MRDTIEAKQIILDGTTPHPRGEKMVVNNYQAMVRLLDMSQQDLTLDDLLEIHTILGDGALDADNCAGRVRSAQENVRVEDSRGDVWFHPPRQRSCPRG